MTSDETSPDTPQARRRAAAARALAEAEARRAAAAARSADRPPEINGPAGPEPTRYGDWEKKGIASDF
jgi:hypothetical protein